MLPSYYMNVLVPRTGALSEAFRAILQRAGKAACFAADEFFAAKISNPHTRRAYARPVGRFLTWCEAQGIELPNTGGRFASIGHPQVEIQAQRGRSPLATPAYYAWADPEPAIKWIQSKRLKSGKSRRDSPHREFSPQHLRHPAN